MTESESVALPLGDAPILHNAYYIKLLAFCQDLFSIFLKKYPNFFVFRVFAIPILPLPFSFYPSLRRFGANIL